MGITGISNVHSGGSFAQPARDAEIRIAAGPAGTGKVTTFKAILARAMKSNYSVLLPPNAAYASLWNNDINLRAASSHVGASYLTEGVSYDVTLNDLDERLVSDLSAFARAIMPRSTLANGPSVMLLSEVNETQTYSVLVTAKAAMASSVSGEEAAALIQELGMGSVTGDPLAEIRQSKGLDARDVDTALKSARAKIKASKESKAAEGKRRDDKR